MGVQLTFLGGRGIGKNGESPDFRSVEDGISSSCTKVSQLSKLLPYLSGLDGRCVNK